METPNHWQSSASSEVCSSTHLKHDSHNGRIDASKLESASNIEQVDKIGNSTKKSNAHEVYRTLEDGALASSVGVADNVDCSAEPRLQSEHNASEGEPCKKTASVDDTRAADTEGTGTKDSQSENDFDGALVAKT